MIFIHVIRKRNAQIHVIFQAGEITLHFLVMGDSISHRKRRIVAS